MERTTQHQPDARRMVHTVSADTYAKLVALAGDAKRLPEYIAAVLAQHAQNTASR